MAQAVLKKVPLPGNAMNTRGEFLPFSNFPGQESFRIFGDKEMRMIRHDQENCIYQHPRSCRQATDSINAKATPSKARLLRPRGKAQTVMK